MPRKSLCVRKRKTLELLRKCNDLNWDIEELNERIRQFEVYKSEAEIYKQRYVDEVQKRLELVKFLENTHLTN